MVDNGLEAVDARERAPYDLVLMDVQMPEMDGLEATRGHRRAGRRRIARRRSSRVTADAMQDDRERCLAAGMDDYVTKPIRPAELAEALERATRQPRRSEPDEPEPDGRSATELDPEALDRLLETTGGDPEFVADLLDAFAEEAPGVLADLPVGLGGRRRRAGARAPRTR